METNKNFTILVVIAVLLGVIAIFMGKSCYDKYAEEKAVQQQMQQVFGKREVIDPLKLSPEPLFE